MKHRLLVMNGSKILQTHIQGNWQNKKVEKTSLLKPGIYNIYNASKAQNMNEYQGIIVHSDNKNVFQQNGKKFIVHNTADFETIPSDGSFKKLKYEKNGNLTMESVDLKKRKIVQKF